MLEHIKITNYRCFRKVRAPLRPLTVLVGPNDSGKSSFLEAVVHAVTGNQIGRHDVRLEVSEERAVIEAGNPLLAVATSSDQRGEIATDLLPMGLYCPPSSGVAMVSPGFPDDQGPPHIGAAGQNIPTLIDYMLRRDRKRFFEFVDAMRGIVDGLEEIEIATPDGNSRRVDLVIDGSYRISAERASTGVKLLLFFTALAFHPTPPKTILLEEPENGVHPKRLKDVVELIRGVTQGVHADHLAQVVVTTHSPYLLDFINPAEDQVLVFRRASSGERTVEPVDEKRLGAFLDEFMLGEVWINEGEDGLVRDAE